MSFTLLESADKALLESGSKLLLEPATTAAIPFGACSATASATITITATTRVPLDASSGQTSATLVLSARTAIPLGASSATTSATLTLAVPTTIVLLESGSRTLLESGDRLLLQQQLAPATVNGAGSIAGTGSVSARPTRTELDLFLVVGASNASGEGDSSLSTVCPAAGGFDYYSGGLHDIVDPVDGANTGSSWPAFCAAYVAATGRAAVIVAKAVSGSAQTVESDVGNGNWTPSGTLWSTATTAYDGAITTLTGAGYTVNNMGVLWAEGGREAKEIDLANDTKANYKAAFTAMIARFRTHYSSTLRFYFCRTGYDDTTGDTSGYQQIRAAQEEVDAADSFTYDIFLDTINFEAEGLSNGQHYTQAGYNKQGHDGALALVGFLGTAPAEIPLAASSGASSSALAITAQTGVPLNASSGVSSATLTLSATTQVPLGTSAALSTATLALTAKTTVALGTAAATTTATLALAAPATVPLQASAALSTATLTLTATTAVPLGSAAAISTATLSLTAKTTIPLNASAGVSTATLTVSLGAVIVPLQASAAASSATLSLKATTVISLGTSDALSTATLALDTLTQYARPAADIATTGWTVTPLWSKLDEVTADDADLVTGIAA